MPPSGADILLGNGAKSMILAELTFLGTAITIPACKGVFIRFTFLTSVRTCESGNMEPQDWPELILTQLYSGNLHNVCPKPPAHADVDKILRLKIIAVNIDRLLTMITSPRIYYSF